MIHIPCIQGSQEWLRHRMGKPTSSEFERIIQPAKWEPTKGSTRRKYKIELLTELMLDMPLATVTTAAFEHGHEWEEVARADYESSNGVDITPCGFCTTDDGTIGASLDGFVGDHGIVEFKSPLKPEIHVGYWENPDTFLDEHFVQTQGELFVADDRQWVDLVSYFSGLPTVKVRVVRNPEFQQKLGVALRSFVCEFSDMVERAKARGVIPEKVSETVNTKEWITQADLDAILEARKVAS